MGDEASHFEIRRSDTVLDLEVQEAILNFPHIVGELLQNNGLLEDAIWGALRQKPDQTINTVMGTLSGEGYLDWERVKHPGIHKALGRIVFGDKRYFISKQPNQ